MRTLLLAAALGLSTLANAQVLNTRTFSTEGHPMQAIWTPDGLHVLVTVSSAHASGIEVFGVDGGKLKREAYQPLDAGSAQGILILPHTRVLAVGLGNAGVGFLPLDATLKGKAKVGVLPQGDRPGSLFLAATPDGRTLFVNNEYLNGGSVGVIALRRNAQGELDPATTGQIQTPISTPGIAMSADGSRLYAVAEVLPQGWPERIAGHTLSELRHDGCVQGVGGPARDNGGLFVIDTAKAAALALNASPQQEQEAVVRHFNAGCSPVREAVSSDGKIVYVTARGDNKVLAFDAAALENDPDHAFLRAIPTGGEAPVGLALFDSDRKLLVTNSNRFFKGRGSVTVIDLAEPAKAAILQTIASGEFPRNITVSADGKSMLVTVYLGDEVMLLTMK